MLNLSIITQEKKLLEDQVESITAPTVDGEVTILTGHVPLFTKLQTGELIFKKDNTETSVVITDGFMDVGPQNKVTVMVDSAVRSADIDVLKAKEARKKAQQLMEEKIDQRDFMLAEAQLRQAMMEIKVANRRSQRSTNLPNS